jgi:hypothetical protein
MVPAFGVAPAPADQGRGLTEDDESAGGIVSSGALAYRLAESGLALVTRSARVKEGCQEDQDHQDDYHDDPSDDEPGRDRQAIGLRGIGRRSRTGGRGGFGRGGRGCCCSRGGVGVTDRGGVVYILSYLDIGRSFQLSGCWVGVNTFGRAGLYFILV